MHPDNGVQAVEQVIGATKTAFPAGRFDNAGSRPGTP
jgi:hypothetical protein